MTIEVFDGGGRSFIGEEAVLSVIAAFLQSRGEDAVILTNVRIVVPGAVFRRTAEIDLVVATEAATLAIEVKDYRLRVVGGVTGKWVSPDARGDQSRKNAWIQALDSAHALQNAIAGRVQLAVGCPQPVVLFANGIPDGSQLPFDVDNVAICGPDRLPELLAGTRSSSNAWPIAWLKEFALGNRMSPRPIVRPTRVWAGHSTASVRTLSAEDVMVVPRSAPIAVAPPSVAVVDVPIYKAIPREAPYQPRKAGWLETLLSGRRKVVLSIGLLLLIVVIFHKNGPLGRDRHQVAPGSQEHASNVKQRKSKAGRGEKQGSVAQAYADRASQQSKVKSEDAPLYGGPKVEPLSPVPPSQQLPASQLPPCPKGIDRLGCIPDEETIRKLRGAG
ncbi:nuclease-related domain-containing protein [Ralstonia nicotianae]